MRLLWVFFVIAVLVGGARDVLADGCEDVDDVKTWCAPELLTLGNEVCAFEPPKPQAEGKRTLIIYLHGVIQPDGNMQWNQQRGAARVGAKYGFTVMMPRGRRGIGPTGMEDWWTWPTAIDTRVRYEESLVKEWMAARVALESRMGKPFDRVIVFGFSNGAYYATSLAMRGRLEVDGYGLFAGGSGAAYHEVEGRKTKNRVPIGVAWGEGDPSFEKQVALAKLLKRMRWPSKGFAHPRAGHAMTDEEVFEVLTFLGVLR